MAVRGRKRSGSGTAPTVLLGDDVRGIQSIELGGSLLRALLDVRDDSLPLRDVAQAAGMSASNARRYLLSFARIGLVSQDPASGHYELGPLAIRLGLAAIARTTVDRVAPPIVRELRRRLQETVVLAIWSDNGPTVLQVDDSQHEVTLNARIGSTLAMTRSATGLIFGAYFDTEATEPRITVELSANATGAAPSEARRDYEERLEEVRRHGIARIEGRHIAGVSALAAPVFDHSGSLVAALGVIGHRGILDVTWDGIACSELKRSAALLSERCGYAPGKPVA